MNPVSIWLKMLLEKADTQTQIDDTTQKIVQSQNELHQLYVNHLNQVIPPNVKALFPKEIITIVAQYAHPTPTDMFDLQLVMKKADQIWCGNKILILVVLQHIIVSHSQQHALIVFVIKYCAYNFFDDNLSAKSVCMTAWVCSIVLCGVPTVFFQQAIFSVVLGLQHTQLC